MDLDLNWKLDPTKGGPIYLLISILGHSEGWTVVVQMVQKVRKVSTILLFKIQKHLVGLSIRSRKLVRRFIWSKVERRKLVMKMTR